MKKAKRLLALLLSIVLLLSACAPATPPPSCDGEHTDLDNNGVCEVCGAELEKDEEDEEEDEPFEDDFLPVLRFAITSDVHVRSTSNDYGSEKKLERFLGSAYEYAESYTPYKNLDGIFIVGDLTQDGKSDEYTIATALFDRIVDEETLLRVAMGNHEFHAYGSGDARFTLENIAKSTARFNNALGYEHEDSHHVVNGYHFIVLANDTYESRNYYDEQSLAWLKGEIEAAIAEDPAADKPIFVMQHEPPESSYRGFTGGDSRLGELLKDYPRIVDFSGHTHRSILDPQSIWQDGFTAIGTGGLAYLGYNMAGHPKYDNSAVTALDMEGDYIGGGSTGARTGAMYYIVEVDKGNNIRLKIYDLLTESFYGEPIVFKVGEGEDEVFGEEREAASLAPVFPSEAKIEVKSTDYNLPEISFTTPTGGDLVQYYKIVLTGENGELVFYRLGCMHYAASAPRTHTAQIRGHKASGRYDIKIYAYNCYGKESLPLEGEITIDERTLAPDIMSTVFNPDGTAASGDVALAIKNTITGEGAPTVSFNEELGRNTASFNGGSGYVFSEIDDYYGLFKHSLSIEAIFRAGESEENMAIGANNNSAGFGLYRQADGSVRFIIRYNNGASRYLYATTAQGTAPVGEWVHAVATFNARGDVRIYINGEAATLYDTEGKEIGKALSSGGSLFQAPTGLAAALVVGGDISSIGLVESGFVGDIAAFNLYSRPLAADEAQELYSAAFTK